MEMRYLLAGIYLLMMYITGVTADEVCHGPLGCFSNDPPFQSSLLPEPMLPEGRDVVNVTYALFVRHQIASSHTRPNEAFTSVNVAGPIYVTDNSRPTRRWKSMFVVTKPTKLIIHDYGDSASSPWVFAMVERFLALGDCQVITVNWNSRDGAGGYYQAAANVRVVGAEVALLLRNIQEWKQAFEFESVHLIGHGLGAHAASYAGETLKVDDDPCLARAAASDDDIRKDQSSSWWQLPSWLSSSKSEKEPEEIVCAKLPTLAQITGLDPSGLWFESVDALARLDSSDAMFVDVIHTDAMKKLTTYFGHGISRACGNIDFYPNGGYEQPGCEEGLTGLENLQYPGSTGPHRSMDCNHVRAISYYMATMLQNACPMTAFPCNSWTQLCNAECTSCTHNFDNRDDTDSSLSPSTWLSYLAFGGRRRRTSAPMCLKLGLTAVEYWREHKRQAKVSKSDVTNLKSFLKTSSSAPYCVKYIRVELELNEPWSEGTLSFRFTDNNERQTEMQKVGRVSNWGSTSRPVYLVTVPTSFGRLVEVEVLWELTVVSSWWPGIGGYSDHRSESRRELRLPLRKIQITEPPLPGRVNYCSPRRKLRSGREVRFTRCGSDAYQHDVATFNEDEEE